MNVSSLLNFLKRKQDTKETETPEGFCPNCWGRQEYEGKFYEAVKNNKMDVNIANPDIGWVQEYADKHLTGIELKHEDDEWVCEKCKITYKPSDEESE